MYLISFEDLVSKVQAITRDTTLTAQDTAHYCDLIHNDVLAQGVKINPDYLIKMDIYKDNLYGSMSYAVNNLTSQYLEPYLEGWLGTITNPSTNKIYEIYIKRGTNVFQVQEYDPNNQEYILPTENVVLFLNDYASNIEILINKVTTISDLLFKEKPFLYIYGVASYNSLLNNAPEASLWFQKYQQELRDYVSSWFLKEYGTFDYISEELGKV